jgi:ribosomal protein L37AE/L43A
MKTKVEYQPGIADVTKLLCEKYWLMRRNKPNEFVYTCQEIGQAFGFRPKDISNIAKTNSHLVVLNSQCIDCGKMHICHNRAHFNQLKLGSWRCDLCWKAFSKKTIQVQPLLEKPVEEESLEEEQKQVFLEYINNYRTAQLNEVPSVTKLSEVDRLLLAATIDSLGAEDLKTTISLHKIQSLPLSPIFMLDEHILHHLFELNLLLLAPEDNFEHISINEEQKLEIDYQRATFEFAYDTDDLNKVMVGAKSKKDIHALVVDKQFGIWCEDIQLAECLNYLTTRSKLNDLDPSITEKLFSVFKSCLAECSVSVMHYIIYRSVEMAAKLSQKSDTTQKHLSSSISTNIEQVFSQISTGMCRRNNSFRDDNHPQSAMTKLFFDHVFRIEDCGFYYTLDALFNPYRSQKVLEQVSYSMLGSAQSAIYSIKINISGSAKKVK